MFPSARGFEEVMVSENKYIADGSYFHPYHFNPSVQKVLPGEHEFLVDRMNYEAIQFMERNKEKPFFLYLSHYAVHTKLMGDPETVDHFRQKAGAGTSAPSASNPENDPYKKYPADYAATRNNPHLAAQLKHMDDGVGEILQYLKENGLMEKTLVIFTSDNGGALDVTTNAPLRGGKVSLYEGGTRIPLIMYGYGVTGNTPKEINTRVMSTDFFPTFCEMTGAEYPDQPCDGVSICSLLNGGNLDERDLFWYYPPSVQDMTPTRRNECSVISGKYKLIENYLSYGQDNLSIIRQELFDLEADPYETENIVTLHPDVAKELSAKMAQWRSAVKPGPVPGEPQIIYVSPDGTGSGTSWSDAAAFAEAAQMARGIENHQIWMKKGTYLFDVSVNFDSLFVYGGFAGTENRLSERDWVANQTILDGNNKVSPLRNRTTVTGDPIPCVLDGVIVQNGLSPTTDNGGGMMSNNGTVIRNCIFRNNQTQNGKNGAAVHCQIGTTVMENCLFVNNTSTGNGGAIQVGGGITKAILINCTLVNNEAKGLGGAIGAGAGTSNCILVNTIAYNNRSSNGTAYNSYAQNANINGGGKVASVHSAIESSSTKFAENDDVNHIALSRERTPGFLAPSDIIGKAKNESDINAANAASYALAEGSICIDAGKVDDALDIQLDLAGNDRIQGLSVDIGAYEYASAPSVFVPALTANNLAAFVAENELYVSGAKVGSQLCLFDIKGSLVHTRKVTDGENYTVVRLPERGVYFVRVDDDVLKIRY